MVNDLFFKDRCAKVSNGIRRLAQEFVDFLFLTWITTYLIVNCALQFFFRYFYASLFTDFGENQTEANATFSKLSIFFASSFFSGFFVFERAASLLQVEVDLLPDVVEFCVNKLLWGFELVIAIESVENLTLYLLTSDLAVLAFDLLTNNLTQTLKRFDAELLCGFVVENEFVWLGNFLHGDVEGCFLTCEMGCAILSWESYVDDLLIASLDANELLFKAGNELTRTEDELRISVCATIKWFAIKLAEIVDRYAIFIFGLALFGFKSAGR